MKVLSVDDELPNLNNFKAKVKDFDDIESLVQFQNGLEAIEYVRNNDIDVAFLDMEMPMINGIELAEKLKEIDPNIKIIFVTAFEQYALKAFSVDAIGYVLKPYTSSDIRKELDKAKLVKAVPKKHVVIQTMPSLVVSVDDTVLRLGKTKVAELFAVLVDHGDSGITVGEAIAYLWPDKASDEKSQQLYRVTFHRLMETLKEVGVEHIIGTKGRTKYLVKDQVECDLYYMLDGNRNFINRYAGEYLVEYSWAEMRNAQLYQIHEKFNDN